MLPVFVLRDALFRREAGFTLAELIAVIAIVGVLSVVAASRLSGTFANTRGFYDQVFAEVQYARKTAIAQRRAIFVRIEAANSRLCYIAADPCTAGTAVASPTGQSPFTVTTPAGVAITVATFQFSALGEYLTSAGAVPGASLTVTVSGEGNYSFTVERDTGYVHP